MARETQIRRKVEAFLIEEIRSRIDDLEDNLAAVVASEIPGYNPNWCAEEVDDYPDYAIQEIVDLEMSILFANQYH